MADGGVSGKALAVSMVGVVLCWSALRGKKISTTVRDLIYGKNPADNPTVEVPIEQANAQALTNLLLDPITGQPLLGPDGKPIPTNPPHAPDDPITAGTSLENKNRARLIAQPFGWSTGAQWDALDKLWTRESGWSNTAQNPTSTAYGIAQFLDSTWAGTGHAKTSDPSIQILAGLIYIKARYGDPIHAWAHETTIGWY